MSFSPNSSSSSDARGAVDWLMDVPCTIDVVLGTARVKVAECTRLAVGSVVRLRQAAGSDLEVRASGVPFATGEVVIVDERLSLRVGRVLPPVPEELS